LRWLITGGCGFIGLNLIEVLASDPKNYIRVVDNLSVGSEEDLITISNTTQSKNRKRSSGENPVELIIGDIQDEQLAIDVCENMDIIVHLAANTGIEQSLLSPLIDFSANALGTINYLEAARKNRVKRFVFASSGAVVGDSSSLPINELSPTFPKSPYGVGKLVGEKYCYAYSQSYGLETVCLRFSNVYGPRSEKKNSVVARVIKNILSGGGVSVHGTGMQTRDFIYVHDLVDAVVRAGTLPGIGGEVFQIATNTDTSILDLIHTIESAITRRGFSSPPLSYESSRQGDVLRNFSNIHKAKSILDWAPLVHLNDGVERTVEYYLGR
jgi:UDP-glucose 4-epimerase